MSIRILFLIFGILLLTQCVLSHSSEEDSKDDSKDSSEEKIDKVHLKRHLKKLYTKLADKTIESTRKNFEPIIKNLETNAGKTNTKVEEKLIELKNVLEKANTRTEPNGDHTKEKQPCIVQEIRTINSDLDKILTETTNPTEQDEIVRKAEETFKIDLNSNLEAFADSTVPEIEKYWNGLSTTEQKGEENLHTLVTEYKNDPTPIKKIEFVDKALVLGDDVDIKTVA